MADVAHIHDFPDHLNRRRALRQKVIFGGKLVHSGGAYSMNVTLKNMTAFGARVILPSTAVAPDVFDLIDMKNGDAFECRVVWRDYPQIGVVFESRSKLDSANTPRLNTLKSLWLTGLVR
jgi:hypothetical protein